VRCSSDPDSLFLPILFPYGGKGNYLYHKIQVSMINSYNPSNQPNPQEWLALDEAERINLVLAYHNQAEDDMEGVYLHSTIHAVIEHQAASGDNYPVKATLERLMKEE